MKQKMEYVIQIVKGCYDAEPVILGSYKDDKTARLMRDNWIQNSGMEVFINNYIPWFRAEDGTQRWITISFLKL